MEPEPGDVFVRRTAAFIRLNERGLAEAGLARRRRRHPPAPSVLGWLVPADPPPAPPRPVTFAVDSHRLFYLLMRVESLAIDVGSLDVPVHNPARPMHYTHIQHVPDDTLSLASFRSSLSAISLPAPWWRTQQHPIDAELKYIYSSFTKIPALHLKPPGPKVIAELQADPPIQNALPLDAFRNLQSLETTDIDPRTLLGWDRLADSLRSLAIRRSGLEDVADIFITAVHDDQARRDGSLADRARIHRRRRSWANSPLPASVPEDDEQEAVSIAEHPARPAAPSPYKWGLLRHLSLPDNALTFLPTDILPYLVSVTHLDLSSNLFVSVPHGLSVLHHLVSLNLSDNMIDSVLGIYTQLGQVLHLNLSRNRLESICGLERLVALERVDLRSNHLDEAAEVGRLATLPNIAEVSIEGNPLTEIEDNYRVACFDFFHKEGKSISLDGTPPTFYERRSLSAVPLEQTTPAAPSSPPVVPIGPSKPDMPQAAPETAPPRARPKKRKAKRIVDLNGGEAEPLPLQTADGMSEPPRSMSSSPLRPSPLSAGHRRSYSAFEPPDEGGMKEAEEYRARIEALRTDMGEGWLRVFSQREALS